MRFLTLLLFIASASISLAKAEPISFSCVGEYYQRKDSYFVTYDIETDHFVYEGQNIEFGEIVAANDERLKFSLRASGGRILLYFDRKRRRMTWPGLSLPEQGRARLNHDCTPVTSRTVLSAAYRSGLERDRKFRDPVDAFSITCKGDYGPFFVTMDRITKAVMVENPVASRSWEGQITSFDDGVIKFWFEYQQHFLSWDERTRTLTFLGDANSPANPNRVQECTVTRPRSILEFYKYSIGGAGSQRDDDDFSLPGVP